MTRVADTIRLYRLLGRLEAKVGGMRRLQECTGRMAWPRRGLYFFFEAGEMRSGSGEGRRVVRIGTHGLTEGSRSTLWGRLSQHRGTEGGGGNHRGSIFRLLVGVALARQGVMALPPSWGVGAGTGTAARRLNVDRAEVKAAEAELELRVSRYVGEMPLLWLDVGDRPSPSSERGLIESNAIALLSSSRGEAPDPASTAWLGRFSDRERVRGSGLWNNRHVDEPYCPSFLDVVERRVEDVPAA
ncbi:MAG: hypothetical protein OXH15_01975 [Gammaproteobacteria bacterium]|nr:hypothetical protein [Gammaproteobacteria bacterium]